MQKWKLRLILLILFYSYRMYYLTSGLFDYFFGLVIILTIVVVIILLHRFGKNQKYSKYHDKEYLRTLEISELRFLILGTDIIEDIK